MLSWIASPIATPAADSMAIIDVRGIPISFIAYRRRATPRMTLRDVSMKRMSALSTAERRRKRFAMRRTSFMAMIPKRIVAKSNAIFSGDDAASTTRSMFSISVTDSHYLRAVCLKALFQALCSHDQLILIKHICESSLTPAHAFRDIEVLGRSKHHGIAVV